MMEGMTPLSITLDLQDGEWADLDGSPTATLDRIGVLANATERGKPAIMLALTLNDGQTVIASTTWNLLYSAVRAIEARYGN